MKIIAHRGLWVEKQSQNSMPSLEAAFNHSFGVETDIRDRANELVIAHDPFFNTDEQSATLNKLLMAAPHGLPLALNVKSAGLAPRLRALLDLYPGLDYFTFDHALPDLRHYLDCGIRSFARMSEQEQSLPWPYEIAGVWVDSFAHNWVTPEVIRDLRNSQREVVVVSPELHGRSHLAFWQLMSEFKSDNGVAICTDLPHELREFLIHD